MYDSPHSSSLFEVVRKRIMQRIQLGAWKQGDMIPNELELADIFKVSQGTVRRALKELVKEGVLVRHQGKGTYVASYRRDMDSIRERINWFAPDTPGAAHMHARIVSFEILDQISPKIALLFQCAPDEPLYRIRRELSYGESEIVSAFDDIYLKVKDFPHLTEDAFHRTEKVNPYVFYEETYGYFVTTMEDMAKAVLLNPQQAKRAGVNTPYPAICLQRRSFTIDGHMIELRFLTNVTDTQSMVLRAGHH